MPRTVKNPEVRKHEILDAAMKLFYEKGFEKTSISDIAKSLGISQGLCYRYFDSKEELLDAAVDAYAQRQVDRMLSAMETDGMSLAEIIDSMDSFVGERESADGFYYKLAHGEGGSKMHAQLSLRICAKIIPFIRLQIEMAVERRETNIADADTVATFVSYGQLGILMRDDLTREEKDRRIKSFLREVLLPSG